MICTLDLLHNFSEAVLLLIIIYLLNNNLQLENVTILKD